MSKKILGVSSSGKDYDHFKLKDKSVWIRYTTGRCERKAPGHWDVPIGTVRAIDIIPKTRVSISSLNVKLSQFKVFNVRDVDSVRIYTDEDNGFEFEYYEPDDMVLRLAYFPSKKDEHLRCQ